MYHGRSLASKACNSRVALALPRQVCFPFKMMFLIVEVLFILSATRSVNTAYGDGSNDLDSLKLELTLLRDDFRDERREWRRQLLVETEERREKRQNLEQTIAKIETIVKELKSELEGMKQLKEAVRVNSDQISSLRAASVKNLADLEDRFTDLQNKRSLCGCSTGGGENTTAESCVHPPHLENGQADAEGQSHGDRVRYSCKQGYLLSGPQQRICSNGNWTGNPPTCTAIKCLTRPVAPVNGQADVQGKCYGDKVLYSCNDGYRLSGAEERTCLNGDWTENPPTCILSKCLVRPIPPVNGYTDVEGQNEGDKVRYSCKTGYLLTGPQERNCSNSSWTGNPPSCASIPALRFTRAYGVNKDRVVIEEAGAVVTDEPEVAPETTVRTDGLLTSGTHYWEVELTWSVSALAKGWLWVASFGARLEGSSFSEFLGEDGQSWTVEVSGYHRINQWRYHCEHNDKFGGHSRRFTYQGSSRVTNRLGFLLDTENQTLTVVDKKSNNLICIFRGVNGSKPVVPAVTFGSRYFNRRFRLLAVDPTDVSERISYLLHNA